MAYPKAAPKATPEIATPAATAAATGGPTAAPLAPQASNVVTLAEEANPLTRLPGNGPIERQLLDCVAGAGLGEGLREDLREDSNARGTPR